MDHLVNSIPGGIASYRIEGERITPIFISDGVMTLSGHTRGELEQYDAFRLIHEPDRDRVLSAMRFPWKPARCWMCLTGSGTEMGDLSGSI